MSYELETSPAACVARRLISDLKAAVTLVGGNPEIVDRELPGLENCLAKLAENGIQLRLDRAVLAEKLDADSADGRY